MDFILNVLKPTGLSSHDVVAQIRKRLNTSKVGHAGTLDVEASGVLVIGVGEGTKLLNHLQMHHKVYAFDVFFNQTTDTLDHTGQVTKTSFVSLPEWLDLDIFSGEYTQMPPAYSAVKVNGKKLYEYARKNEPIPVVNARRLQIEYLIQKTPLRAVDQGYQASFEVKASSGLYVRQLALDIASTYHTVAHTTKIHRLEVGPFNIDQSVLLETLEPNQGIRLSEAIPEFEPHVLSEEELAYVKVGRVLELAKKAPNLKVIDNQGGLWGLYQKKDQQYVPLRIFKGV
jgi:tRNA pseudouridine55 synthase